MIKALCDVQEFLEKAHEVSEMHIYTHGNAEYAAEMAKLLDPTKRFFAERIISQVSTAFTGCGDHVVAMTVKVNQIIRAFCMAVRLGFCIGGQHIEACQKPRRSLGRRKSSCHSR